MSDRELIELRAMLDQVRELANNYRQRADKAEARLALAERTALALETLMVWQNGPPLITYTEAWTAAMEEARAALAAWKEGEP